MKRSVDLHTKPILFLKQLEKLLDTQEPTFYNCSHFVTEQKKKRNSKTENTLWFLYPHFQASITRGTLGPWPSCLPSPSIWDICQSSPVCKYFYHLNVDQKDPPHLNIHHPTELPRYTCKSSSTPLLAHPPGHVHLWFAWGTFAYALPPVYLFQGRLWSLPPQRWRKKKNNNKNENPPFSYFKPFPI